ncbi:L-lactate MFS transporter [Streptomyces hygroscopicus]|uniref:L-lactate MFS transporter n=1 Tax=Streptomyces hygroscopicus TaxID=1912 RepID=UPI0009A061CB|nr:OFA family MFS transporter [Streptomyces hygroscopicus]
MGFLDRSRTIAGTGWNRWLIPPAALAIHFSIGQAYAWSVFKIPLEDSLDISGTASALPFQIGILVLGLSAAFGGTLVEKKGPRWAMFVALVAFSSGFLIAALGVATRNYWLVVLGYGGIGGVGLGIGYIAPVSTLMKWFPDRPGMATGTAIMGFGGGALIASPWSTEMLSAFGSDTSGIAQAFLVHGLAYAVFMSLGVVLIRVPPEGWRPAGWTPRDDAGKKLVTTANVSARNAVRTPQFWLLWVVLCMNVTAGIGILEKAAPMIQDFFHGSDSPVSATAATGFVALLSLANMAGRFVWSSVSDLVGRKNVYRLYLGAGALLYLTIMLEKDSSTALFVASTMVILSFYGGGFATAPAYLKDLFGTYQVGAIHGRLLTAWSVAGVAGPLIVDSIADSAHESGRTGPGLYTFSFSLMMGLLVIGFIANELVRPVNPKFHEPEPATPVKAAAERPADPDGPERPADPEEAASSKKSAAPDAHSDPIPAERR